jgi:hypothetical protein
MSASRSQRALAVLTVVALAACTSQRDALIARGVPPAYAEGYEAGCSSGDAAAGGLFSEPEKDASRYAADAQYAKGWDDGFAKCKRDAEVMVRDARLRHPGGDD